MPVIRRGGTSDFPEIAAIQAASPAAAQWDVASYSQYEVWVAEAEHRIAGFLVARSLGDGECELLNLAVSPEIRRKGVARTLVDALARSNPGTIFLEVRESNIAARNFYKSMEFKEIGVRKDYYDFPPEAGIVLKFHSC